MSQHHTSNRPETDAERRARAEVVEHIGTGAHLTPADFAQLDYAHRAQLLEVNPSHYAGLRDGTAGVDGWHPTSEARTTMAQGEL